MHWENHSLYLIFPSPRLRCGSLQSTVFPEAMGWDLKVFWLLTYLSTSAVLTLLKLIYVQ